jgi:hypothetical protein
VWCSRMGQLGWGVDGGGGHRHGIHGSEEYHVELLQAAPSGGLTCRGGLQSMATRRWA